VTLAARARRLSAWEWRVLGESAALAVIIEVALRLLPLARILQSIEGGPTVHRSRLDRAAQERVARLARWPSRVLPIPDTCLRVALVQVAVLRGVRCPPPCDSACDQPSIRRADLKGPQPCVASWSSTPGRTATTVPSTTRRAWAATARSSRWRRARSAAALDGRRQQLRQA
jgi:hypothetical protein